MLVTTKAVSLGGKQYGVGKAVDPATLPPGKAEQLVARRILKDTEATTSARSLMVLRDIRVKGRLYRRGTKVNASRLGTSKVAQMLDHRILGPA